MVIRSYYAFPDIHWEKNRTTHEIDKSFLLRALLFLRSTGDHVTKSRTEDVSPVAQPSPSLLVGGTRAPPTGTTRPPSAVELFAGMFSAALIAHPCKVEFEMQDGQPPIGQRMYYVER